MSHLQKKVINLFLILYPILPGYFRIVGIPSYKIISILCVVLYMFSIRGRVKVKPKNFFMISILAELWLLMNIVHYSTSGIINTILDYVLVLFMLMDYFNSRERTEEGLEVLLNISVLMCLFGLFEFVTRTSLFAPFFSGNAMDTTPELQMRGSFVRSEATFGHAIPFAIYLSINALIASYFFCKTGKRKYQYMFLLLTVTIITTISRAPILVYVLGLLVFITLMGIQRLLKSIVVVAAVGTIAIVLVYYILPSVFNGLSFIWNVVLGIFSNDALSKVGDFQNSNPFDYRFALFSIARDLIRGKEIFGTGNVIEQFAYGNNPYSSNMYYSIDNAYLGWLVRYGIVGLATNLIPLISCIGIAIKRCRRDKLYALLLTSALVLALNWFSVASLGESRIWFILFAMVWSMTRTKAIRSPTYQS